MLVQKKVRHSSHVVMETYISRAPRQYEVYISQVRIYSQGLEDKGANGLNAGSILATNVQLILKTSSSFTLHPHYTGTTEILRKLI